MRPPRLRRWWPLLAAAGLAAAVLGGRRLLEKTRDRAAGPAGALAAPVAKALRSAASVFQSPDQTEQLRQELALARIELADLRDQLQRRRPRESRLEFPRQRLARLQPCDLLFRDPATWFRSFTVDVGSRQGLRPEAGVLNSRGVVGKLAQVGEASSQVQLLSDPACRFAARLVRTGLPCAVVGDGRRGCLLQHLGGEDDVRVGDLVETGAGSRSFPAGVPVGRVLRLVRLDGGLRLQAEVEPAASLERLEGLYAWTGEPKP